METAPIIPWLGGKRRLAEQLLPLFPPHECYVEACAGGAALFFLRKTPAKCEVLNDANGELINLYRVVQFHLEEFIRHFKWSLTSRQIFAWLKDTLPHTLTDIQRAARMFYLQQHAFGGRVSGQTFGVGTTGPAINLLRIEENLSAAHVRLAGVMIEHLGWLECVQRYDREHTLHYIDPPYWETEGYGLPWDFSEYERMSEFARSAAGKVMISINDHPAIRSVFDGLYISELSTRYSVGTADQARSRKNVELVVTNWDHQRLTELF